MIFTNYRVILINHRVISTNHRMILNKVSSHHFYNSFSLHFGVFSPTFYPPDLNDSRASFSFRAFYYPHFHLHILLSYHPFSSFASMSTHCNSKPRRGMIRVASQFIGWYAMTRKTRAFRYATTDPYRVPTARIPLTETLPAIKMAGRSALCDASHLKNPSQMPTALTLSNPYQMPTASIHAINPQHN